MLNAEARENLIANLKNYPRDACLFLDTALFCGCAEFRDPNCRLADRLECFLLDDEKAGAIIKELGKTLAEAERE